MNQQVNTLMQKEVSRKEFLGMSGLAVASIFGFGSVVKLLTGKSVGGARPFTGGTTGSTGYGSGYGSSSYGR